MEPGTITIAVAGALILGGILSRLWDRGRHKLTFLQITIGTIWLIGWSLVDGAKVMIGEPMTHFSGWTAGVVLAGVGQVLAGSLAYLVPVLKGFAFRANRDIMEKWLWLPLITLNAAGLTLGAGFNAASVILSTVWVADFGLRLVRVIRRRSDDDAEGASDD